MVELLAHLGAHLYVRVSGIPKSFEDLGICQPFWYMSTNCKTAIFKKINLSKHQLQSLYMRGPIYSSKINFFSLDKCATIVNMLHH